MELINSPLFADPNLVAYWRMEGNSNDSKGSNNGSDTAMTYGSAYGKYGQGALFNGSTSKITVTHNANQNAYPMTMNMWIKNPGTNGYNLFSKYINSSYNGYLFGFTDNTASQLMCYYFANSGSNYINGVNNITFTALTDGNWHMITYVIDSGGCHYYVDGVSYGTSAWTGTPGVSTQTTTLLIGAWVNSFGGNIDDVSFFSRALTATEIKSLYNSSSGFFAML